MEAIWRFFGLMGTLDESGEGYEPSPLAKWIAVDSKSDYKEVDFGKKYSGDKKVLVVCTEERYILMENGKKFSSGNHPMETAQPLMHLVNAGFDFDVATPTGKAACIEMWAMPSKDEVVLKFFNEKLKPKVDSPKSLADLVAKKAGLDQYILIFLPGGHGAMLGLPEDPSLDKAIQHIKENDKVLMSVCHGPASFLAAKADPHPYKGYKVAVFPDSIDKQSPMIGYLPGKLTWYFGEKLTEKGFTIVNKGADATTYFDRKLWTGASPKACQELGKVAAEKLLEEYA